MDRVQAGVTGFIFLCVGILTLVRWRSSVQRTIDWHNSIWKRFRILRGSERVMWAFGALMQKFLAVCFIIGGSLILFSAFTGRDWPLHYARWRDLWPF